MNDLEKIYQPIAADLEIYRKLLSEEIRRHDDPVLKSLGEHLVRISGKRVRLALALLVGRTLKDSSPNPLILGMAIELLHMATLIHDDIIDKSMMRRNEKSLNAVWGDDLSLVCGDYLYAKAFILFARLQNTDINRIFASAAELICEGEIVQVRSRNQGGWTEALYLDMIGKKTASLFEATCRASAVLAKSSGSQSDAWARFGYCLGMTFQIADDCLDTWGDESKLGKEAGSDLAQNDMSLPMIYLNEDFKKQGRALPQNPSELRALLADPHTLARCAAKARGYADEARQILAALNGSGGRYDRSLADLVSFILGRIPESVSCLASE